METRTRETGAVAAGRTKVAVAVAVRTPVGAGIGDARSNSALELALATPPRTVAPPPSLRTPVGQTSFQFLGPDQSVVQT